MIVFFVKLHEVSCNDTIVTSFMKKKRFLNYSFPIYIYRLIAFHIALIPLGKV